MTENRPLTALNTVLDQLELVTKDWLESETRSRDFQMALGRICYRYRKGLPIEKHIEQARDLIRRKGTLSPLRAYGEEGPK